MPAAVNDALAADKDGMDGASAGHEDVGIEPAIPGHGREIGMGGIKNDEVRAQSFGQRADAPSERLASTRERTPVEARAGRFARGP